MAPPERERRGTLMGWRAAAMCSKRGHRGRSLVENASIIVSLGRSHWEAKTATPTAFGVAFAAKLADRGGADFRIRPILQSRAFAGAVAAVTHNRPPRRVSFILITVSIWKWSGGGVVIVSGAHQMFQLVRE